MEALYDRIVTNEIKMKDDALLGGTGAAAAPGAAAAGQAGWLDTIMNLLPGRAKAASAEPNDEAIRRTHEQLRCVAAGRQGREGVSLVAAGCACSWPWGRPTPPLPPSCAVPPPLQREGQGRDLFRGARQRGGAPHAGRGLGAAAGRLFGAV